MNQWTARDAPHAGNVIHINEIKHAGFVPKFGPVVKIGPAEDGTVAASAVMRGDDETCIAYLVMRTAYQ